MSPSSTRNRRPALVVRRLEPADDRAAFESGDADLDRFFRRFAGQNQFRHHVGTTYVAILDGEIAGFVTVSAAQIDVAALPARKRRRLPGYPLPALRLARLAVARDRRGEGVGLTLLKTAFVLARRMADDIGCVGVVVDAKPDAVAFYERFGFEPMDVVRGALGDRPEPASMFLEIGAIPRVTDRDP